MTKTKERIMGQVELQDLKNFVKGKGKTSFIGQPCPPLETKTKLKLIGVDGNAFMIMGLASRAARKDGWPKEKIDEYLNKARSGDYNNLLNVTMDYFDVN